MINSNTTLIQNLFYLEVKTPNQNTIMIQNNQIQIVKQKMIGKQYKNLKRKSIQNSNENFTKSNENDSETKIQKWKLFLSIFNHFSHLNFHDDFFFFFFLGFKETGKYKILRV